MSVLPHGEYLQFSKINATFMIATALDRLAINRDRMAALVATPNWQNYLIQRASEIGPTLAFSDIYKDSLQYPDQPSPEKQPINKLYFENHGSIVCDFLKAPAAMTSDMKVNSVSIRLFESGAIGVRCSMTYREPNKTYDVDSAVAMLRESRRLAQKLMFEAIRVFIRHWNEWYPNCKLVELGKIEEILLFEKYEYIDFDIANFEGALNIKALAEDEKYLNYLKQLAGFCRMAKPYAWPNYSIKFLREFMENDVGSRDDELWLVYPERFVRYFPNRDVPETSAYAADIVLVTEVLLGLRAVYKSLLEDTRSKLVRLPVGLGITPGYRKKVLTSEITKLQEELATIAYKLSRFHYPSTVQFYAGSAFASRVLSKIESALGLNSLSNSLLIETNKLGNILNSYESLVTHRENVSLQ